MSIDIFSYVIGDFNFFIIQYSIAFLSEGRKYFIFFAANIFNCKKNSGL